MPLWGLKKYTNLDKQRKITFFTYTYTFVWISIIHLYVLHTHKIKMGILLDTNVKKLKKNK